MAFRGGRHYDARMPLDFSIVMHVRHQFGDENLGIGVFAGAEASFPFDCPGVDASQHSLLLFQSHGVGNQQVLEVNGSAVFGGIPGGGSVGKRTGSSGDGGHTHPIPSSTGWNGSVMIVNQGVLRETGNLLRISGPFDEFVVDNVVLLYKTRGRGIVPDVGEVFTPSTRRAKRR